MKDQIIGDKTKINEMLKLLEVSKVCLLPYHSVHH